MMAIEPAGKYDQPAFVTRAITALRRVAASLRARRMTLPGAPVSAMAGAPSVRVLVLPKRGS